MPRILIADDHEVVREGSIKALRDAIPGSEFAEAKDGNQSRTLMKDGRWDCVVLDLGMPGNAGVDLIRDIHGSNQSTPILVFSAASPSAYAIRALRAGARGYLSKSAPTAELVQAVRTLLAGSKYINPEVALLLAEEVHRPDGAPPHNELSDRELQVLELLSSGKSVGQIADHLSLSPKTISTFRTRILKKMGMKTNAELIRYGVLFGLAEDSTPLGHGH